MWFEGVAFVDELESLERRLMACLGKVGEPKGRVESYDGSVRGEWMTVGFAIWGSSLDSWYFGSGVPLTSMIPVGSPLIFFERDVDGVSLRI